MRRRRDLTGWILMGVLFAAAMALIFYILLLRAQHLASMEERRDDPDPQARVGLGTEAGPALVMVAVATGERIPHELRFAPAVA